MSNDDNRESGESPMAEEPAPTHESAPSRKRQALTYAAIALAVVLVLGGIVGAKADQIGAMIEDGENFQLPPVAITQALATRRTWAATSEAVGSIVARRTVPLAAEVGGKVTRVGFESGDDVRRGQLLLSLDAALPRAELAQTEARLRLAELELSRVETLRARGARTDADFERAEADRDLAKAARDAAAAAVRMRVVKAPFAGRIGLRDVEPGQIVQAGTVIASLQTAEAPEVQFHVGEDEVPGLAPGAPRRSPGLGARRSAHRHGPRPRQRGARGQPESPGARDARGPRRRGRARAGHLRDGRAEPGAAA